MSELREVAEAPTPVKGRCGTCDWPTDRLPCPYCAAVARRAGNVPGVDAGTVTAEVLAVGT